MGLKHLLPWINHKPSNPDDDTYFHVQLKCGIRSLFKSKSSYTYQQFYSALITAYSSNGHMLAGLEEVLFKYRDKCDNITLHVCFHDKHHHNNANQKV